MQEKNDGYDHLRRWQRAVNVAQYGEESVVKMEQEKAEQKAIHDDLLKQEMESERYQADLLELETGPWNLTGKEVLDFATRRANQRVDKQFHIEMINRKKQEHYQSIESRRLEDEKERSLKKTVSIANSTIDQIDEMDGLEFEIFIAEVFKLKGYNVETTKRSGDFGVDLIVSKNNIKSALQIKRYSENVGITAIQEIVSGTTYYSCDNSMVVTNSYFTSAAQELGTKLGVFLINRDKLIQLLKSLIDLPDT